MGIVVLQFQKSPVKIQKFRLFISFELNNSIHLCFIKRDETAHLATSSTVVHLTAVQ